eukprot:gene24087-9661_t
MMNMIMASQRGLQSSTALEPALQNFWYPVHFSKQLTEGMLIPTELFGEKWVVFRDVKGAPCCLRDQCAHRACPLSADKDIPVVNLPSTSFVVHAKIEVEVPVEHGLLIENLLDLAHAPFTHTSTFARGWPIPEAVRFHAKEIWKHVAGQVLGEDLVLVTGQQDMLERGGDTWANPMQYDKLAVQYRRWRNSIAAGDDLVSQEFARSAKMGAGELFEVTEAEGASHGELA